MSQLRFLLHKPMHILQLHFIGRSKWISVETTQAGFDIVQKRFERKDPEDLDFITIETRQGQTVYINADRLKLVRYLYEPEENPILRCLPSIQYAEKEVEDYTVIKWRTKIWIEGLDASIDVKELGGHDWVTLSVGIDMPFHFMNIEDDDQEVMTIRRSSIEMFSGFEISCYESTNLRILENEISQKNGA